ncbi:MAG TPA: hypothetical protein GX502_05625 [Syntrophaceticus sp.]|nr:hypothetical protein [Syntrophaceticus sp.]
MSIPYQNNSSVPHIANLLTSILIHYPEIATINLDPKDRVIKFSFYLKNINIELEEIEKYMQQALQAYYYLEDITSEVNAFTFEQLDNFTIMEFCRDINSLSQKEISLVIALLKDQFGASLISDEDEDLNVDNQTLHEELISYMLENAKMSRTNIELIALRDEGKVVVYNK